MMSPEKLEENMRKVLAQHGKPQAEIDKVVPFLLDLPILNSDNKRQIFFDQWKHTLQLDNE